MPDRESTPGGRRALRATLAILGVLTATAALALQAGQTAQGRPFVSGGVSHEELVALHQRRDAYTLWVVTAALRSGAHLADVRVAIRDAKGQTVFDQALDGPWLFVDLPLGRYSVRASYARQTRERMTTIHRGDHHQVFFYFDTDDSVGAEHMPPFDRNPYDGARK
ncbi:MAG TPA: hypothetical protein VFQ20_11780 [Burkholderiaceae bacterium]|nr:hypothetical protein [Burkholderiaceae bacterium]